MPAYATWLERELQPDASLRSPPPPSTTLERTLLVCDFEPDAALVRERLGGDPALVVLPQAPARPDPAIRYATFEPGTNPLNFGADALAAIANGLDTVAFLVPRDRVYGRTLVALHKLGISRCLFLADRRITSARPLVEAARRRARRVLGRWRSSPAAANDDACVALLRRIAGPVRTARPGPHRIVHVIGTLNAGGAERQVCYAAAAQREAGHDASVLLLQPPVGGDGHYLPLLSNAKVPVRQAGSRWDPHFVAAWRRRAPDLVALGAIPSDLRRPVVDIVGELLTAETDIVHAWLDDPNVAAFLAASLAGVPGIVLSVRNVSPRHCPRLLLPWMRPWYAVAAHDPRTRVVANSLAGARDYEAWIELAEGTIAHLPNAFVPPAAPDAPAVAAVRDELGVTPGAPLVAGIFRLDPEKRPHVFLDAVERIARERSDATFVHAGGGTLTEAVHAQVRRRGLGDRLHLLGRREDVPAILVAADVMLLTSEIEGTPNVSLEAQHFGCVPVVTEAGGSAEAIDPSRTGVLVGRDDLEGLVDAVVALLGDADRRRRMADAGRRWVAERFDPASVRDRTLALYADILGTAR
jgi:glycosyltransferase involved in cell wall biosynthesis